MVDRGRGWDCGRCAKGRQLVKLREQMMARWARWSGEKRESRSMLWGCLARITDLTDREGSCAMLLAVGGESRRIVLGEVPPAKPEQEQEPAQDVAAQWRQQEGQGTFPVPQPRQRTGKGPEARARGSGNRKSCRRRFRVSGNHTHSSHSSLSCILGFSSSFIYLSLLFLSINLFITYYRGVSFY